MICLKYIDDENGKDEVVTLTDGTEPKKGDRLTFVSPQGPVRIKIIPLDAYQPNQWKTGKAPMLVLRSLKEGEPGQFWCGGVVGKKQWGMNKKFYVPELELRSLRETAKNEKLTLPQQKKLDSLTELGKKDPTPGHGPYPPPYVP